MGELHEIIVDRMKREFKVESNVSKPPSCIQRNLLNNGIKKLNMQEQSGGRGQYGHVKIILEPNPGKFGC